MISFLIYNFWLLRPIRLARITRNKKKSSEKRPTSAKKSQTTKMSIERVRGKKLQDKKNQKHHGRRKIRY